MLSLFDRTRRVARPLAPRTRKQPRTLEPRVLEREQVMTGGDAGSAVADDSVSRDIAHRRSDFRSQIFRRAEQSLVVQVPLEEMIPGPWNVAAHPVDRLRVAAIPFRCPGIDEAWAAGAQVRRDVVHIDR